MASIHQCLKVRYAGLVVLALVFSFFGLTLASADTDEAQLIPPNVIVAGVPVGGMTFSQAAPMIETTLRRKIERPIHIIWDDGESFLYPMEDGISLNMSGMMDALQQLERPGGFWQRSYNYFFNRLKGTHIPLHLQLEPRFDEKIAELVALINRPARDVDFGVAGDDAVYLIPSRPGLVVDVPALRSAILGMVLEVDRQILAPAQTLEPRYPTAQARYWGIKYVMGKAQTSFDPYNRERVHNLRLATQALDGIILAPNELFSFNERVGPRLASAGYKEAPVVIAGELVPDVGGGVCQVSSTLYNAVLLANLEVRNRSPHTIPSTYVPLGLDAAVAYDYLDFRFFNSSGSHIYIRARIVDDLVVISLLGERPQEKVRLVSNIETVHEIPREHVLDPTLPRGEVVVQPGHRGYTVAVWRVTEGADGEVRKLIARSTYKARPEIKRTGIGDAEEESEPFCGPPCEELGQENGQE